MQHVITWWGPTFLGTKPVWHNLYVDEPLKGTLEDTCSFEHIRAACLHVQFSPRPRPLTARLTATLRSVLTARRFL